MSVSDSNNGKKATTKYKLIRSFIISNKVKISHLKCQLLTGRTHQIRVHMSYIGNPLIGDNTYSRNNYYKNLPLNLKILFLKILSKMIDKPYMRVSSVFFILLKKKFFFESSYL